MDYVANTGGRYASANNNAWSRRDDTQAIDMVSNIVKKFDNICMEIKQHINGVEDVKSRAELYLSFLDKDCVKTMINTMASYADKNMIASGGQASSHELSKDGHSLVLKNKAAKNTSSSYEVVLKAKNGTKVDPVAIYRDIAAANDIVANDWLPFNIADLRIEMMSQNDALKLMEILNNSTYGDERITNLFDVTTLTKSNYAIKSIAIDQEDTAKLKWLNRNGEINLPQAINALTTPTNKHWFSNGDVENLEVYKLGATEKFVIKIFISKNSFHRFLSHPCANRKVDLGLSRPVTFQEEVRHDACWKCLDFGHSTSRCLGTLRCRYCGEGHKALDCKQKQAPTCFRCRDRNARINTALLVNHDALANVCPFIKERRDTVRNNLRTKFGGSYDQL